MNRRTFIQTLATVFWLPMDALGYNYFHSGARIHSRVFHIEGPLVISDVKEMMVTDCDFYFHNVPVGDSVLVFKRCSEIVISGNRFHTEKAWRDAWVEAGSRWVE